MDTPQRRRPWLHLLAALTLLGLLIYPATRWIVRKQVTTKLILGAPHDSSDLLHQTASRHPDDFQLQLADATQQATTALWELRWSQYPDYSPVIQQIATLIDRFPNRPAAYANYLRYAGNLKAFRPEDYLLSGREPPDGKERQASSPPEQFEALVQAAEKGETLDPDNAYFPYMRAWGLLGLHRDSEALDAVRRAGAKPRWEDYTLDDIEGRWRLDQETFGERGALHKHLVWASVLFPHYAAMRQTARVIAYKAIEAEQAGQTEEGLELRHALMHYGSLMRVQSRSVMGNLVGVAITAMATGRPGGAPVVKRPPNAPPLPTDPESAQRRNHDRLEKYYAYLRSIGKEEEARWAQAELESGQKMREVMQKPLEDSMTNIDRFGRVRTFSLFTLANLLSLLVLGGAAALAAHVRPKRGLILLRSLFVAALGLGLYFWHTRALEMVPLSLFSLQMPASVPYGESEGPSFWSQFLPRLLVVAISLAVPLLIVCVLGVISRLHRVPISAGVGRGLRGVVVPMACILMLLYGGTVMATAREEARENSRLQRLVQHEGRYYVEASGGVWPGAVPEPQEIKQP